MPRMQEEGGHPRPARIAIGNWKLHMTLSQTREFFEQWNELALPDSVQVGFAVPFTALSLAASLCHSQQNAGYHIGGEIGAQNCAAVDSGAYTGEVLAEMVKEAGGSFVILGHSERRRLFGETNAMIHAKIICAAQQGLRVICCCGETMEERQAGHSLEVIQGQLRESLVGTGATNFLVAYEPIWAIGSGQAATPADVATIVEPLQKWLNSLCNQPVPILYGGSVNAENARGLMSVIGISGVLVGGPSTDPLLFHRIVESIG